MLPHVLLALLVILVLSRALAILFARFGQPAVVGEIVAGIVIGPSILGHFAPRLASALVPDDAVAPLGIIANIGVVLFMFLVGLELDTSLLSKRTRASAIIATASVTVPFGLGLLLALYLHPRFATHGVRFFVFALFIAVSMAVTAFPVLARILADRKMQRSPLGVLALACAAINDVAAWCLLAVVVSFARSGSAEGFGVSSALVVGLIALFAAFMIVVVRPIARRRLAQSEPSANLLALVLGGLLASALVTEAIGVHALFGAFVFGAIIPHDSPLARTIGDKLTDFIVVLLLPAFFAFTGLRTRMGLVHGYDAWVACILITVIATAGKLGGTFVAARLTGIATHEAVSLGVLMNTRGLMELVVINVGLDLGIISPVLFTMLVMMALATTLSTTPILQLLSLRGDHLRQKTAGTIDIPKNTV
jgi:Kef-type K+ transport system membrane component KefB